jgi:hypothetical protein
VEFLNAQMHGNDAFRRYAALLLRQGALDDSRDRKAALDSLWEMPRDTLSILQLHLWRDRSRYASSAGRILSQRDRMENWLLLLLLSDIVASFSGALSVSLLSLFMKNPSLVSRIVLPKARVLGTTRVGERVRILRLPGKQIVYLIASKSDAVLEKLFEAPERDIDLFAEIMRKYSCLISAEDSFGKFFGKLQGRSRRVTRGFKSVSSSQRNLFPFLQVFSLDSDLVSMIINQLIRMHEIRRRDGWVHLELGDFTMVLQLFRKSKNIREGKTKRFQGFIKGSSENRTDT